MENEMVKYLVDIEEQKEYVEKMDCFHDYRVGTIAHNCKETYVTIERVAGKKPYDVEAVWIFEFIGVSNFEMELDTVIGTCIFEIIYEEDGWRFDCTNGYLKIKAAELKLRVPIETGNDE